MSDLKQPTPPSRGLSSASSDTLAAEPNFQAPLPAKNREDVHKLARQITRLSLHPSRPGDHEIESVFDATPGGPLDPSSANFNARTWAKAITHLIAKNSERSPGRTAGVAFKDLNAHGFGSNADYQKTVSNFGFVLLDGVKRLLGKKDGRVEILKNLDGVVRNGEMLVVLGPPGSGCSTFLKSIAGETDGFIVADETYLNYQGIGSKQMKHDFRGETIYTAEVDMHFPQLSVGDTLTFAAQARAPRHAPEGVTHKQLANHLRDVVMAMFGISHTVNTQVGNDFIRGVSGGERKRVTIAEAFLSGAPLQLWDNSTRGLDSANAIEFCRTLKLSTEMSGATAAVAIYQAPQAAYDVFDKVLLLFKGYQIYFGPTTAAKEFFVEMGFFCPDRQTTADFLTSLTSDLERRVAPGFEGRTPRTPEEFARAWKESKTYHHLRAEIDSYEKEFPIGGPSYDAFLKSRNAQKAKSLRKSSPYTISYTQQVMLCLWRGWRRLIGTPENTLTSLFGNSAMALIIGSVFYNLEFNTDSFFQRGALLFFAILMAAFSSALEILTLYAQRDIVDKHAKYAFYHPSAEALASMIVDLPYKITNAISFNLIIYFMSNLRREPGPFFFFLLISFTLTLCMSGIFRTIGATSRTLSQALAPAALLILALVIYTGFVIPTRNMLGWSRWINYLDPISYGFEALMINEFHGRDYPCSTFVPAGLGYGGATGLQHVCSAKGSVPGQNFINGDTFINVSYNYYHANKWRNYGITIAFTVFFTVTYVVASEYISGKKSKGEVLLFQRGKAPAHLLKPSDAESGPAMQEKVATTKKDVSVIPKQTSIFQWEDIVYDIQIKGETRRILDHVDGWVKPGTLTALMGVSGAGKTTLLDVLATRVTMGVVSGKALVDGQQRDDSFQRKTGYVQQQDLHLSISTVREALTFSALLRQPASVPRQEKIDYVEEVIKLLDMTDYADACVGVPGEGLNVEQRKRLTIGVELAAKPQLLLFLDEPTSGLDSQTAWAICDLMAKLKENGQAILCTIHQPSAMLFQRFDRLLFLAKGGRTIYYGEIGENSKTLTSYFERNGAHACAPEENPAEWMLDVIGAAPGSFTDIDYHQKWLESPERADVKKELRRLEEAGSRAKDTANETSEKETETVHKEFAAPFGAQFMEVTKRVFQQYWRTPSYIYSKLVLCTLSCLFIGFSFFKATNSQQGLQNQMFSIFMLLTIFGNLVQQIMPHFVTQRSLYEVRERPSKTYSWATFMLSNIVVELPWNSLAAVLMYLCFYYPIGLYRNAQPTDAVHERGALFFLMIWMFMIFTSTFAHLVIAAIDSDVTGSNIANLMFSLCLIFCGVLASPDTLPGFWIFMYRISPFTYIVEGLLTTALANTDVVCSDIELLAFDPPSGTCGEYLQSYIAASGGYLVDPSATTNCSFCSISSTNTFLAGVSNSYSNRWRDFGLLWAFVIFNVFGALFLYWLVRVPKKQKTAKETKQE